MKGEKKEIKTDKAINSALEDYLRREQKVFEAIRSLETVPGTGDLVKGFEAELGKVQEKVKAATRGTGAADLKGAYKDLEDIKKRETEATGRSSIRDTAVLGVLVA